MLAPVFLALALTQGCPEPPSRNGPPPCAAANVPGCIPGYVRDQDRWGRVIYRCDPAYARSPAPQPGYPEPQAQNDLPPVPPPFAAAPPRPAPAPQSAPPYARPYGAPYAPAYRGDRGNVGLVLMPGATTRRERGDHAEGAGAVALELRGDHGGGRVRLGFESMSFGSVADVALKYDFNDRGEIRPFLAVAVGAASVDPEPGWHLAASASAGVDLYPTRNFFVTLELKQRAFTRRAPGTAAYGLEQSGLPQTAFFFGVGLYL
jgi:hypothetical protein